jgi:hypothetical protein
MSNLLIATAALAVLGFSICPSLAVAQTPGMVAAYAFNEGAGPTVTDASGNNNTGSLGSGVSRTPEGKFGSALAFNGSGVVTIPPPPPSTSPPA